MEHTWRADKGDQLHVRFSWTRTHLFDRLAMLRLYELFVERGTASDRLGHSLAHLERSVPLSTVEYQQLASSHVHIASDQMMDIAETYQSGNLSYPRTETDSFKESFRSARTHTARSSSEMGGVLVYVQRLLDGDFHYRVYHVSYVYRVSYPRVTLSSQRCARARVTPCSFLFRSHPESRDYTIQKSEDHDAARVK